jgi:hypothetical protein
MATLFGYNPTSGVWRVLTFGSSMPYHEVALADIVTHLPYRGQ